DPISPSQLETTRGKIKPKYYNWLYLSVWLGLRPLEIDPLHDKNHFRLLMTPQGLPVLSIYQTKLISIPPRHRWKLIPLFRDEQKQALEIIQHQDFHRPLTKMVKKLLW